MEHRNESPLDLDPRRRRVTSGACERPAQVIDKQWSARRMAPKAAADPEQHALANPHEKRWEDSHQEVRSDGPGRYENQVHVSPLGVSVSAEKLGDIASRRRLCLDLAAPLAGSPEYSRPHQRLPGDG